MSVVILKIRGERADLSNKYLSAVWALSLGNSTDKLVLAALADYASEQGRCFPSMDALSRRTDLSERAIRESLNRLKASGYLTVNYRHRHSSVFELHIGVIHKEAPDAAKSDSRGRQMPLLAALGAVKGAPSAARTLKDPSLNLRDAKSVSAEDQELEAHAQALCFRRRMGGESAETYRAAMKAHEEAIGSSATFLLEAAGRKRL